MREAHTCERTRKVARARRRPLAYPGSQRADRFDRQSKCFADELRKNCALYISSLSLVLYHIFIMIILCVYIYIYVCVLLRYTRVANTYVSLRIPDALYNREGKQHERHACTVANRA